MTQSATRSRFAILVESALSAVRAPDGTYRRRQNRLDNDWWLAKPEERLFRPLAGDTAAHCDTHGCTGKPLHVVFSMRRHDHLPNGLVAYSCPGCSEVLEQIWKMEQPETYPRFVQARALVQRRLR